MTTTALLALFLLAPASPARREAVVVRAVENMYSGPALDNDVVSQATLGQVVGVLETKGAFRHVETPDRYRGWIPSGALVLVREPRGAPLRVQGAGRRGREPHGEPRTGSRA